MPAILAISSTVVRGHVGNSAAVFALRRLGLETWCLPTIVLSNHPGYSHMAGSPIPPETVRAMVDALAANGWFGEVSAILCGYMPSPRHVATAAAAIDRIRAAGRAPLVMVDPIIGDHPKGLYVDEEVAGAIRDELVPRADIITPNIFELGWLSGLGMPSTKADVMAQVDRLSRPATLVTSVPLPSARHISTVLVGDGTAWAAVQTRRPHVPHGTGDLIAALVLGHRLRAPSVGARGMLAHSVAALEAVVEAAAGRDELALAAEGGAWIERKPWPVVPLETLDDSRASTPPGTGT